MRSAIRWAVVGFLIALAPAIARPADPTLTVFAAADLAFAFDEIVPRFERVAGAKVTLVLGSTGNLATQIEHGAPADVFFAADQAFVDRLIAQQVLIPESRALYAQGRLVLATAKRLGPKLTDLRALLDPRIRHVAIANPEHAPYGRRAEEALRAVGIWEMLKPKLVYGENIRHTLQFVQSGAAEAGLVALAIANVPEVEWVLIDVSLHAPLNQATAVIRWSPRPELGRSFIQFVNGPEGRAIMKRYGFLLPGEF
jgi:molybdate transport system substrate-binding protein